MTFLHFADVIIDRDHVFSARGLGLESQKSEESLLVLRVRGHTFFDEKLEVVKPFLVLFRVALSFIIDELEATSGKDIS